MPPSFPLPIPQLPPQNVLSSNDLENRDRGAKIIPIILLGRDTDSINRDHVGAGLGAQTPDVDFLRTVDGDHVFLAGLGREAGLGVVVEEGVESIGAEKRV